MMQIKINLQYIFQYLSLRLAQTLCMAFLRKEKCFRSAPINGGSDGTYKMAAAITQFAGGSKSTSVLIMQS